MRIAGFNTKQRILLGSAALTIAGLLLAQINQIGLDDANWLAKRQFTQIFVEAFERSKPPRLEIDMGIPMGPATEALAWKSAFMMVLLSMSKRTAGFEDSPAADTLLAKTAVEVAYANDRFQAAVKGSGPAKLKPNPQEMQKYLHEVVACRFSVTKSMSMLARNAKHPLDPIFKIISSEFPFGGTTPDERENTYGPVARNIMRDLTR